MNHLRESAGFTLIELVVVIVVLGFLAVIALPKFIDLEADAKAASFDGVVGGVRAGIAMARAGYFAGKAGLAPDADGNKWPDNLGDTDTDTGTAATIFFEGILDTPVQVAGAGKRGWKSAGLPLGGNYHYYYDADANDAYDPAVDKKFYYDPSTGLITVEGAGF